MCSGRAHRGLDDGERTGGDRPCTRRAETQWRAAGRGYFVSRCKGGLARRRKIVAARRCGVRSRRSRPSVTPQLIEVYVGAPEQEGGKGSAHGRLSSVAFADIHQRPRDHRPRSTPALPGACRFQFRRRLMGWAACSAAAGYRGRGLGVRERHPPVGRARSRRHAAPQSSPCASARCGRARRRMPRCLKPGGSATCPSSREPRRKAGLSPARPVGRTQPAGCGRLDVGTRRHRRPTPCGSSAGASRTAQLPLSAPGDGGRRTSDRYRKRLRRPQAGSVPQA